MSDLEALGMLGVQQRFHDVPQGRAGWWGHTVWWLWPQDCGGAWLSRGGIWEGVECHMGGVLWFQC